MPHERAWHKSDGQIFANIAHTLTSKGTSQILLVVNAYIGPTVSRYIDRLKSQLGERGIPMLAIVKSNGGLDFSTPIRVATCVGWPAGAS